MAYGEFNNTQPTGSLPGQTIIRMITTYKQNIRASERPSDSLLITRGDIHLVQRDSFLRERLGFGVRRVSGQTSDAIRFGRVDQVSRDASALVARYADDDSERGGGVCGDDHN